MDYTTKSFNLQDLYYKIWGYRGLSFPSGDIKSAITPNNPLNTLKAISGQFKKTTLGVPILVSLTLKSLKEAVGWTLPIEVMVRVQGKQKVIKRYTHHLGSKGSVKEQWGLDDYSVYIRGLFFLEDSYELEDTVLSETLTGYIQKLNTYFEEGLVEVDCPLLELFGITRLFIEDINYPFNEEGLQIIPFECKAVSDFKFDDLLTQR